jgi:2-amino-1-hydroxyethylphosphonate dioxygenase (glycine-forming)
MDINTTKHKLSMLTGEIVQSVNEIMALYEQHGNEDYIGEPVSQIEHMCQCAQLAEAAGADDDVVLAAFLHDIGHLCEFAFPGSGLQHMDKFGIVDHEKLGSDYLLRKGFSPRVAKMVANHVHAKRYLTFKDPQYYHLLSEASKHTLEHQGGRMTAAEAAVFETDPLFEQYIALRRWDEQAKQPQKPLPSLDYYRQLMTEHLAIENS